jgi:hypothetical protein
MGKRGKQYNRKVILELVEKWLPVTMDDWGALVPLYKVMANEEEERTPLSLSVAYQAMAKVQKPTGTATPSAFVSRILTVRKRMQKKTSSGKGREIFSAFLMYDRLLWWRFRK